MIKKIGILFYFCISMVLFGCENEVEKQNDIESFVTEYKKIFYQINDPLNSPKLSEIINSSKPYLTEDEFENLKANRIFDLAPEIATYLKKSVILEDITFEKINKNDDETWDCYIILKIKISDNLVSEIIEKRGQLTIIKIANGELKISRDWEERVNINGKIL